MSNKVKKVFEPNIRFYLVVLILFAAATFFFGKYSAELAGAELACVLLLYIAAIFTGRRRRGEILRYIESVSTDIDSATKDTLVNFPMPMVIFSLDENRVIHANERFLSIAGKSDSVFEQNLSDLIPNFSTKWLMEGKNECPDFVTVGGRQFLVYGGVVRTAKDVGEYNYLASTYWVDVTEYAKVHQEYAESRPVFSIIMIDNYDDLLNGCSEKDKSAMLSQLDERIGNWTAGIGGYLCKYDRDRYVFVFENRYLQKLIDDKFTLLERAHDVMSPKGIHSTISIGIGKDGASMNENFEFATLGIEMALSRGGDQAVVKNKYNFEFYGGRASQIEKRTKVKSRVMANSLSQLIGGASRVFIMGHKYSDLDSIGSAVGLCCICRKKKIPANIVVDMEQCAAMPLIDRMRTLPEYADVFIQPQEAILSVDGNSLLIVVDTSRPEQVESDSLLFSCNRIAVIDHHRRSATYIQNAALNFHEPYASSASELVTELLQYTVEQADILRFEAEALLAGIVLDTKNFTLRTGGRTFDAAAFLRRAGADTTDVKRLLQNDLKTAMARYAIVQKAKVYKAGIAISVSDIQENRIIAAQAADELLNILGIQASFVLFPEEGTINISARSLGDINVQVILEKLGGGGNKATAGAQIKDRDIRDVVRELVSIIDQYLADNEESS